MQHVPVSRTPVYGGWRLQGPANMTTRPFSSMDVYGDANVVRCQSPHRDLSPVPMVQNMVPIQMAPPRDLSPTPCIQRVVAQVVPLRDMSPPPQTSCTNHVVTLRETSPLHQQPCASQSTYLGMATPSHPQPSSRFIQVLPLTARAVSVPPRQEPQRLSLHGLDGERCSYVAACQPMAMLPCERICVSSVHDSSVHRPVCSTPTIVSPTQTGGMYMAPEDDSARWPWDLQTPSMKESSCMAPCTQLIPNSARSLASSHRSHARQRSESASARELSPTLCVQVVPHSARSLASSRQSQARQRSTSASTRELSPTLGMQLVPHSAKSLASSRKSQGRPRSGSVSTRDVSPNTKTQKSGASKRTINIVCLPAGVRRKAAAETEGTKKTAPRTAPSCSSRTPATSSIRTAATSSNRTGPTCSSASLDKESAVHSQEDETWQDDTVCEEQRSALERLRRKMESRK